MQLLISIIVILFLLFFVIRGFKKGFLKLILTTLSLVVTLIVATFLLTPVSEYLAENTKIEQNMEKSVEKHLGWSSDTDAEEGDDQLAANLDALDKIEDDELRKQAEEEIIDGLKMPVILKNSLFGKNSISEYIQTGVESFKQYVVRSIAMLELKILTYIGLVVAIFIVIRLLLLLSKVIAKIPVIKGINRFLGGIIGLIQGLLILWVISLFISLISQTPFGAQIVDAIHGSAFLTFIYEQNIILKLAGSLFTLF